MKPLNLIIRDSVEDDFNACMALDHTWQTEYVWQMTFQPEGNGWRVVFRTEKLPRAIDLTYLITHGRLTTAHDHGGLLVAHSKDTSAVLGYLTVRYDGLSQNVIVRDIVVTRDARRQGVGTRLFNVARRWAQEKNARFLIVETQSKNHPSIQFCQRQGLAFCGFNDRYFADAEIALFFGQAV